MKKKKALNVSIIVGLIVSLFTPAIAQQDISAEASTSNDVVINEVAWMGTTNSYTDEWLELHNTTDQAIDLSGWTLNAQDGTPSIDLSGTINAGGYYLLERTDDSTVPDVDADLIYTGGLGNTGEHLELRNGESSLVDSVDDWHAGDNSSKATMERIDSHVSGTDVSNWDNSVNDYGYGFGTPKGLNSLSNDSTEDTTEEENIQVDCTVTPETINNVSEEEGAINVYFNKCADTSYSSTDNEANYNVNLEDRLIDRLNQATESIDLQTYEINLPGIIDTLIAKADEGIDVRIIADAKDSDDPHYEERYKTMRLQLERMVRGNDGVIGTSDDVQVFSESPMFAVEDTILREEVGLPSADDIDEVTVQIGYSDETGRLFVEGEEKSDNAYYSTGTQMHNKFAIIDSQWVFTGSWNFTITGLYGTEENMEAGILDGNQQHVVEINWPELASIYEVEFNEMWGTDALTPDIVVSNFNTRKTDNTIHEVNINGTIVESYFSPTDNAVVEMANYVKTHADENAYFTIFAWSDQDLVNELKYKWEGSYEDNVGEITGFDVKGVFDSSFWNQWWSASIEMRGETASQESENNPNIRWANEAPVFKDNESRKLHSKTMLIDADTDSDPTVLMGATNWSNNSNNVNDENMLFIHDKDITNQFVQELNARYLDAGGAIN